MAKKNVISYLLNPKNWWLPLLVIFIVSIAGVTMIGAHTYTEAPPIPSYVSEKNETIFSKDEILKGQTVFQQYALMEYGSMFGDGANRGPDFTAEALHQVAVYMNAYYQSQLKTGDNIDLLRKGVAEQVKAEIKTNRYSNKTNAVLLSAGQVYAVEELVKLYNQ